MLDARQHVSSAGYVSTLMTTSTHANPTNNIDASRFEEGGAGGFGAASKASGAGHVPFVPLSGGARAKYSTYGCWFSAEPIVVFGSTSSRGKGGAGGRSCAMLVLRATTLQRCKSTLCQHELCRRSRWKKAPRAQWAS